MNADLRLRTFSRVLEDYKRRHGLSIQGLADLAGVSRRSAARWLSGETTPEYEALHKLWEYDAAIMQPIEELERLDALPAKRNKGSKSQRKRRKREREEERSLDKLGIVIPRTRRMKLEIPA